MIVARVVIIVIAAFGLVIAVKVWFLLRAIRREIVEVRAQELASRERWSAHDALEKVEQARIVQDDPKGRADP